jgi:hypothetical protein
MDTLVKPRFRYNLTLALPEKITIVVKTTSASFTASDPRFRFIVQRVNSVRFSGFRSEDPVNPVIPSPPLTDQPLVAKVRRRAQQSRGNSLYRGEGGGRGGEREE